MSTPQKATAGGGTAHTPVRKSKTDRNTDDARPGDRKDPKSFFDDIEQEARIAAYCRFDDIGEFRRFLVSPYVVVPFLHYKKLVQSGTNVRRLVALTLLRDLRADNWVSNEDPAVAWPVREDYPNSRNEQFAGISVQMLRDIQVKELSDSDVQEAHTDFRSTTGKKLPNLSTDDIGIPYLDEDPGEDILEAYNRCLCLILHLNHVLSPSIFSKRLVSSDWAATKAIASQYVPGWMRMESEKPFSRRTMPDEVPDLLVQEPSGLAVTIKCKWQYESKSDTATLYREYAEAEGLDTTLPQLEMSITVFANTTAAGLRDLVRTTYALGSHNAQIFTARLVVEADRNKDADMVDEEEYDTDRWGFNVMEMDWDEVKSILWGDQALRKVLLSFTTQLHLGTVIMECAEPPAALRNLVRIEDGDVTVNVLPQNSTEQVSAGAEQQPMTQTAADEDIDQAIHSSVTNDEKTDPLKIFRGDKDRMLAFYGGHDVTTAEGILAFQRQVFSSPKVVGHARPIQMDSATKAVGARKGLLAGFADELAAGESAGFTASMNHDHDDRTGDIRDELQYYSLQHAMVGTAAQVGPPINICIDALNVTQSNLADGKEAYKFAADTQTDRHLFPYQVNGLAWLLIHLYGSLLTPRGASKKQKAAIKKLRGLQTGCAQLGDQTGIGKTIQVLAAILKSLEYPITDAEKIRRYRMKILVVPSSLIAQWADEILDHWPALSILIAYDTSDMDARLQKFQVSAKAMRKYPSKKYWPRPYDYIFDSTDPRTGSTIMITSFETLGERTLTFENKGEDREKFTSNFSDVFDIVVLDESQKVKDSDSRRWKAVKGLNAKLHCLVTATAMLNTGYVSSTRS